jgi:RNA polymerase sigma-70 factor, ECF subfamily
LGLLALMLYAEARRSARRDVKGEYVPLAQQDPAFWNAPLISEAEALLLRARTLGSIGHGTMHPSQFTFHSLRASSAITSGISSGKKRFASSSRRTPRDPGKVR